MPPTMGAPLGYVNSFNPAIGHLPHRRRQGVLGGRGPGRRVRLRRRALPGQHGGSRAQRRDHRRVRLLIRATPRAPRPRAAGSSATTASTTASTPRPSPADALPQQVGDVADQVQHVGPGERPTRGNGSVAGSRPHTSRITRRISQERRPGLQEARSRSCAARRKSPVQGTGPRRTGSTGPSSANPLSRAGPKPVGASFTMASV